MAKKQNNEESVVYIEPFLNPMAIFLGSVIIASAIFFGFKSIDGVPSKSSDTVANDVVDEAPPTEPENPEVKTTIDDDAIYGDKNKAKVAIVEFTDFECPFCKRHHEETMPEIIKNYVDTGKAIYVIRDLPLSFHEPNSTEQALAAECVQDLGGDKKYFDFVDLVFETTTSNKGLPKDKLYGLAEKTGVDKAKFTECLDTEKFKDEVANDSKDAAKAGIGGTPGFVIGVLGDDGSVDGVRVSGALPYDSFKQTIDEQLDRAK